MPKAKGRVQRDFLTKKEINLRRQVRKRGQPQANGAFEEMLTQYHALIEKTVPISTPNRADRLADAQLALWQTIQSRASNARFRAVFENNFKKNSESHDKGKSRAERHALRLDRSGLEGKGTHEIIPDIRPSSLSKFKSIRARQEEQAHQILNRLPNRQKPQVSVYAARKRQREREKASRAEKKRIKRIADEKRRKLQKERMRPKLDRHQKWLEIILNEAARAPSFFTLAQIKDFIQARKTIRKATQSLDNNSKPPAVGSTLEKIRKFMGKKVFPAMGGVKPQVKRYTITQKWIQEDAVKMLQLILRDNYELREDPQGRAAINRLIEIIKDKHTIAAPIWDEIQQLKKNGLYSLQENYDLSQLK